MKYFVSADIHGFYDEWMSELKIKGFEISNPNHKIILCGDIFDRGCQPKQIVDFILNNQDKIILIRGNHEDLIENCLFQLEQRVNISHHHWTNGTLETIAQLSDTNKFDLVAGIYDYNNIKKSMKKYFKLMSNAKDYYETEHYIFVHGWIPIIENCNLYDENWRTATKERWDKSRWLNPVEMYRYKIYDPNKKIVCGHWHCSALWHELNPKEYSEFGEKANFEPFITDNMIALDSCTTYSKKVNVLVIED